MADVFPIVEEDSCEDRYDEDCADHPRYWAVPSCRVGLVIASIGHAALP